jgi:hypothetical protein
MASSQSYGKLKGVRARGAPLKVSSSTLDALAKAIFEELDAQPELGPPRRQLRSVQPKSTSDSSR